VPGSFGSLLDLLGQQTWKGALAWTVVLGLVAFGCSLLPAGRWRTVGIACREAAIVMGLLGLWRYVGHYVRLRVTGGMDNGLGVWNFQQAVHLPSEVWVQSWVLPYPDLVRFLNLYYMSLHLTSMAVFLVWMWWRHRQHYPRARTLVAVTLLCMLVQFIPVAPPRMFPELGFVDTAQLYGQSVYGWGGSSVGSQLAAMPSVHVAWAVILAWFAWRVMSGPIRYLFLFHALMTIFVVVVTANHWWMDGIVAVGLMALVILAQGLWAGWREDGRPRSTVRADTVHPVDDVLVS
jgi:hypothetical protein